VGLVGSSYHPRVKVACFQRAWSRLYR
jgi:hypothetical protein